MNEDITIDLENIGVDSDSKDLEMLFDGLMTGTIEMKSLFGMNSEQMEAFYSLGHHLYTGNKYDTAEKIFRGLCILDSMQKKYWIGLAASLQMQEKYDAAVEAYGSCFVIDPDDPEILEHMANCYIAKKDITNAIKALEGVVEFSGEDEKYKAVKERAGSKLNLIQQANKKNNESE